VIRTYLELDRRPPVERPRRGQDDLDAVAAKLDADHFGLDEVKKRILEHMAVLKLAGRRAAPSCASRARPAWARPRSGSRSPTPPGRPFVRIALGGVRDEAEVRGHRRTYVGALPGRIISAIRKAKREEPVILLDEIDKLGPWLEGSPEAALLEVLDPEQNKTFTDHYLELPFDLSEVLFIARPTTCRELSPPLRDRLEIIELSGYTTDEKVEIARKHLLPKQLKRHGLEDDCSPSDDETLRQIIEGLHPRGRRASAHARASPSCAARWRWKSPVAPPVARRRAQHRGAGHRGRKTWWRSWASKKFTSEKAERRACPAWRPGLAWTPVGGDILFIETSRMPGKGNLRSPGSSATS
jgi:ATP-dependent Lon protease